MAANSRLLQQLETSTSYGSASPTSPTENTRQNREVSEARTRLMRILHNDILDFKRTRVETVLACCETLLKCHRNIVDHPNEPKYRKIKAANTVWVEKVEVIAASRDFLLAVGWRIEVVDFARSWIFNAAPDSTQARLPGVAVELLEESVEQLKHKLTLGRKEDKKAEDATIRERTRLRIQEDRQLRRDRDERAHIQQLAAQSGDQQTAQLRGEEVAETQEEQAMHRRLVEAVQRRENESAHEGGRSNSPSLPSSGST